MQEAIGFLGWKQTFSQYKTCTGNQQGIKNVSLSSIILKNLRFYTDELWPQQCEDTDIKEMCTLTLAREALVRGQKWFDIAERGCCFL